MYVNRTYRNSIAKGLKSFPSCIKETDLLISVDAASFSSELIKRAEKKIMTLKTAEIFSCPRPGNSLAGIFAGESPFTGKIAVEIPAVKMPLGICTSSGTVGPSLSLGKADAAIIISRSTALADAAASAAGNVVQTKKDVKRGVDVAKAIPGIQGAVLIKEDQLAVWGEFEIVRVKETSPRALGPR